MYFEKDPFEEDGPTFDVPKPVRTIVTVYSFIILPLYLLMLAPLFYVMYLLAYDHPIIGTIGFLVTLFMVLFLLFLGSNVKAGRNVSRIIMGIILGMQFLLSLPWALFPTFPPLWILKIVLIGYLGYAGFFLLFNSEVNLAFTQNKF